MFADFISFLSRWLQKDSLMDLSFHVPTSNTQFIGDEHRTSAQVRLVDY